MPYELTGPFNGLTMTGLHTSLRPGRITDPRQVLCPACGQLLNRWDVDWDIADKPEKGPPFSTTADGFHIASPSFRRRYEEEGFQGLAFRPLSSGYFAVRPVRWIDVVVTLVTEEEFAPLGHKTFPALFQQSGSFLMLRPVDRCPECSEWRANLGVGTMVIAPGQRPPADREIVGTTCLFGSDNILSYRLIIGDGVRAVLKSPRMAAISVYHKVLLADDPAVLTAPEPLVGRRCVAPAGAHMRRAAPP